MRKARGSMGSVSTRNKWLLWAVALFVASGASNVFASIHTYYNVLPTFETDGFSASWLHAATSALNGSSENGALLNGDTSSRIAGSLEGDLSGNTLSNISGSVSGLLKQLAGDLNSAFGTSFSTSTTFELALGGSSNGGHGWRWRSKPTGRGPENSRADTWITVCTWREVRRACLMVRSSSNHRPNRVAALSPNRGNSYNFSLWGWDWMHDGAPVDGSAAPDWTAFLSSLGYTGDTVYRTAPEGGTAATVPLGIAMYVVDPPLRRPVLRNQRRWWFGACCSV